MVFDNDTIKTILIVIIVMFIYNKLTSKKEGYSRRFGALEGSNNIVLTDNKGNLSSIQFPKGMIMLWQGSSAPEGWAICDGSNGTPDLRGKFVLGYSSGSDNAAYRTIGGSGGSEKVSFTMSVEQMPPHNHKFLITNNSCNGACNQSPPTALHADDRAYQTWDKNKDGQSMIQAEGGGKPITIDNMPPFYTLSYIMKL